jgi:heterotetrameric sarcosine oxidase beta subunit
MRFSALKILTEGLTGNRGWGAHWRDSEPAEEYDIVIVGGGGHGLSTAYYLAKEHGLKKVAVLEKGYIGSGNIGRNTTIVRANYFLPGNSEFYSHSLKLWEGLEADLNYNVLHSQRGQIGLFHSDGQRDVEIRRANSIRNQGDVTSMCYSPTVETIIAQAFLRDGRNRMGQTVKMVEHLSGVTTLCEVCNPIFFDPEGGRLRG